MYSGMQQRGPPIRLLFNGEQIVISCKTLRDSLPWLWRRQQRMILRRRILPLSALVPHRKTCEAHALRILFRYLLEIDDFAPVSAAITNGLDELFEETGSRHIDGPCFATEVFVALGLLFDPWGFGCSQKMFKQMEAFFLKHSEELFAARNAFRYIVTIDLMSLNGIRTQWDTAPVLSCVIREWEGNGRPHLNRQVLPELSQKSRHIIIVLANQAKDKMYRRLQRADQHGGLHLCRPQLGRRSYSDHGSYEPPSRTLVHGTSMHPDSLVDFCLRFPEKVYILPDHTRYAEPLGYSPSVSGSDLPGEYDGTDFGGFFPPALLEAPVYNPILERYMGSPYPNSALIRRTRTIPTPRLLASPVPPCC